MVFLINVLMDLSFSVRDLIHYSDAQFGLPAVRDVVETVEMDELRVAKRWLLRPRCRKLHVFLLHLL